MLQSRSPRAVLVVSNRLTTPVLLLPGQGVAQAVPLLRLVLRDDGRVRLLRGDELRTIGGFELTDDGIRFSYEGVEARLQTREPLVGETDMGELFKHSPDYRLLADAYRPDQGTVSKLQGVGEGYRVRVVFGSWCHVCKNFLPRGLKMQELIGESSLIEFEYYGLPTSPWDPPHPEVERLNVRSLPTAIVYKGDKEIARYSGGDEWQRPEAKLWAAIEKTQ